MDHDSRVHKLPKPETVTGRVYSASELSPEEISRIEAHFSKLLSQKLILKPFVDKSLIAGIKVEACGSVWDGSARGTLMSLRGYLQA